MAVYPMTGSTSGPARRQTEVQDSIVMREVTDESLKADDIRQAGRGYNPFSGKWVQALYVYLSGRFQRHGEIIGVWAKESTRQTEALMAGLAEVKKCILEAESVTFLRKETQALRTEKARLLAEVAEIHEKLRGLEMVASKMDEAAATIQLAKSSYLGVLPSGAKGLVSMIAASGGGPPKPNEQPKKEEVRPESGSQPPVGT